MSFSCSSADDQSRPELLTVVNVLNICYKIWIIIILSVKCGVSLLFLSSSCMFPCSVCGWVGDLCWPLHQSYVTGPYTVPPWQYCTVKSLIGCHSNHSSVASYVLTDENPVKLVSHQSFCGLCLNFLQEVKCLLSFWDRPITSPSPFHLFSFLLHQSLIFTAPQPLLHFTWRPCCCKYGSPLVLCLCQQEWIIELNSVVANTTSVYSICVCECVCVCFKLLAEAETKLNDWPLVLWCGMC